MSIDKEIIINIAKEYLKGKNIKFAEPGKLGRLEQSRQEVIFLDPLLFDPEVAIVEPEDIRVWVDIKTQKASLIDQM